MNNVYQLDKLYSTTISLVLSSPIFASRSLINFEPYLNAFLIVLLLTARCSTTAGTTILQEREEVKLADKIKGETYPYIYLC